MASFHKLTVIGRLVMDPEVRSFANGGRVAKFGLPINFTRPKKNPQTGEWEGDSFIIYIDAFNRENGTQLADLVEQYLKKGRLVYVEGRLKKNDYVAKDGTKVSRPVMVADNIQFLDSAMDRPSGEEPARTFQPSSVRPLPQTAHHDGFSEPEPEPYEPPAPASDKASDIPF
jgi:single-strand DNA-binding protein